MDKTPNGRMPLDPARVQNSPAPRPSPPRPLPGSDRWPTVDLMPTLGAFDLTADQPASTGVTHRSLGSRLFSEAAFQNLRNHLAMVGLALLLALPLGGMMFFLLASAGFAFDDRTFWNSQSHSLAQFWYAALLFVVAAAPPTFVLLRRGYQAAVGFVIDRGYWKVLLAVFVVLPAAVGITAFVAGHLVVVLGLLALLLILLVVTGGF